MPNSTPANRPAPSVPSRLKIVMPRIRAINNNTGSAPAERMVACSIGGMSGSASLTAIRLKPQLRHSISITATAPGLSGRPAEFIRVSCDDIEPCLRLVAVLLFLAVHAGAGDFHHGQFRRKARGARRGVDTLRRRHRWNFANRTAALADQECHHRRRVMVMRAGEDGVAALDAVDLTGFIQKISRA